MPSQPKQESIQINFCDENGIKEVLRCSIVGSMRIDDNELLFQRVVPLHELDHDSTGEFINLEALPKVKESDLDLPTINFLLISMKSAFILSNGWVYRALSRLNAALVQYGSSTKKLGGKAPKSRLARIVSQKHCKIEIVDSPSHNKTDEDKSKEGKNMPLENLSPDPQAWFHCLGRRFSRPEEEEVLHAFSTCVDSNSPQPQILATDWVPRHLLVSDVIQKAAMKSLLSKVWILPCTLYEQVREPDRDNKKLLRQIQIQALLRLQLLAMNGEMFLKIYEKKLCDRKKKRKLSCSMSEAVIREVISILEMAHFVLDMNKRTQYKFFSETIPVSIYRSIPDKIEEIFDASECPNPFEKKNREELIKDEKVIKKNLPQLKQSTKRSIPRKRKENDGLPLIEKSDEQESHTSQKSIEKSDSSISSSSLCSEKHQSMKFDNLTKHSVALTATKRSNPLIKDAKATYVGSHFRTRLANIGTHYHEVSRINKNLNPRTGLSEKSKEELERTLLETKKPNITVRTSPTPTFSTAAETPDAVDKKLSPSRTLFIRKRMMSQRNLFNNNLVVGETPQTEITDENLFSSPTLKRAKLLMPTLSDYPRLSSSNRRESSAILMAQQAYAASRRSLR